MRRKTIEMFIEESNATHGNKYDYSRVIYTNTSSKVEIGCPVHGYYVVIAKRHAQHGQGCPICGIGALNAQAHILKNRRTQEQFLADAKSIHGDKYDYSLCVYTGGKKKMPIICMKHGIFNQHAEGHINSRQGCAKCYHESKIGKRAISGYCIQFFENYPEKKDIPAIVYVAKMTHKNDSFLKVGITTKGSVKQRFYHHAKHGTIITPLIENPETLYSAFTKEQKLLTVLEPFRFFPNRKFGGYTECFKINESTLSILSEVFEINIRNLMDEL